MNFLAHFYLSGTEEEVLIGNFLGDFVKGDPFRQYSKPLAEAILLHRHIDSFTDAHPLVKESIALIRPVYGRYAGVVADMFYDHLLAKHWADFHAQSLPLFSQQVYEVLEKYHALFPEKAQRTFYYMQQHDWLLSYATLQGMETALRNLERRIAYRAPLGESVRLLEEDLTHFEQHFFNFFPELVAFVEKKRGFSV